MYFDVAIEVDKKSIDEVSFTKQMKEGTDHPISVTYFFGPTVFVPVEADDALSAINFAMSLIGDLRLDVISVEATLTNKQNYEDTCINYREELA